MKVRELIEELQELDQEREIFLHRTDGNFNINCRKISSVIRLKKYPLDSSDYIDWNNYKEDENGDDYIIY